MSGAAGRTLVLSFSVRTLHPISTDIEVRFRCDSAKDMFAAMKFPLALRYSAKRCLVDRKEKQEEQRALHFTIFSFRSLFYFSWRSFVPIHWHIYCCEGTDIYICRHVQRLVRKIRTVWIRFRNKWSGVVDLRVHIVSSFCRKWALLLSYKLSALKIMKKGDLYELRFFVIVALQYDPPGFIKSSSTGMYCHNQRYPYTVQWR